MWETIKTERLFNSVLFSEWPDYAFSSHVYFKTQQNKKFLPGWLDYRTLRERTKEKLFSAALLNRHFTFAKICSVISPISWIRECVKNELLLEHLRDLRAHENAIALFNFSNEWLCDINFRIVMRKLSLLRHSAVLFNELLQLYHALLHFDR